MTQGLSFGGLLIVSLIAVAAPLVVRGVPALLYRRVLGKDGAVTAALLQATSVPFIVTASGIGVAIGAITAVTAAALVSAGLLSVVVFPPLALARLRHLTLAGEAIAEPGPLAHRPMGTQD